jgi:predicted RNase H-like nuclease (RuvC/YqgF family)
VEQARSLNTENQKLMRQLQERERTIAELEVRLAEAASTTNATPPQAEMVSNINYFW